MTESVPERPDPLPNDVGHVATMIRGIDLDATLVRFAGRRDRLRHWLADFAETADSIPARIRSEIAAGQINDAAKVAHSFKGRVGTLGMNELHRIAADLELALRQGGPADALLPAMEQSILELRDDIRAWLDTAKAHAPAGPAAPSDGLE